VSQIDPVPREPVAATIRKRLTGAERAVVLARQHHVCAGGCQQSLVWSVVDGKRVYGPMIDEHIIPLELGGSNELSNRELRCVPCAKEKTRADRKAIAKVARILRRASGQERRKQKIRSRGFQRDPLHWRNE
jgi:5-methylcytosine-specific restriction endonuclease McrA